MLIKIVPVTSSFQFGQADTVAIRSIADNLTTSAAFFWQLGRTVPAAPEIPATNESPDVPAVPESFKADDNAIGNVNLDGDEYATWSGANDELPALLLPKLNLEPAA